MTTRPAFPAPNVPVVDPSGIMNPVWYQFFLEMARPSPGWGTVSGTLARNSFDTGVITDAADKQVLGALLTDLRARGILGT